MPLVSGLPFLPKLPGLILPSPAAAVNPGPPSPSFKFNAADANTSLLVSSDGYSVTATAAAYQGARSTVSHNSGRYFVSFWIAYTGAAPTDGYVGFGNASASLSSYIGANTNGVAIGIYNSAPVVYYNNVNQATFPTINATSRRIDAEYDTDNSKVYFRINEGWWNNSSSANPDTNTGGISAPITGPLYAMAAPADNGVVIRSALYSAFPLGTANYPWGQ